MENEKFTQKLGDALQLFTESRCECGEDSCDFCDKCAKCSNIPLVDGSHPKCRDATIASECEY